MEKLTDCPVCGAANALVATDLTPRDYSLTGEEFQLSRCPSCTALVTNPRPASDQIGPYYNFPTYVSHRDDAPGVLNSLYRTARKFTTTRKVALIAAQMTGGKATKSLLDYGCGTGFFVGAAQDAGWQVSGVEVSDVAREAASKRLGQPVAAELDDVPADQTFGVITLWHVLEHIHDLHATVGKLMARLQPGGRMIIAVPNPEAADAGRYGNGWAAYDVPRHLYHFTQKSIQHLMTRSGGRVVEQIGQPLDAFYISLLSEKYVKGNMVSGFWQGFRSTLSAWQSGNYSSIIYIVARAEEAPSR